MGASHERLHPGNGGRGKSRVECWGLVVGHVVSGLTEVQRVSFVGCTNEDSHPHPRCNLQNLHAVLYFRKLTVSRMRTLLVILRRL